MYISKSMMNIPNINQYYKFEENNYDSNYNNNNINAQDIPEEENDNETINSNMYYNKDNINNKISNQNSIINNDQQKPEIKDSYIFKNSTNIETSNYYNILKIQPISKQVIITITTIIIQAYLITIILTATSSIIKVQ